MTIPELFHRYPWLNKSLVAKISGLRPDLIRQYASGDKEPSHTRRLSILQAVRELGKELAGIPTI